jgi:hypothetical protein
MLRLLPAVGGQPSNGFGQMPPLVKTMAVQKISTAGANLKLMVKFEQDDRFEESMPISYGENHQFTLYDDGTHGDLVQGDLEYTTQISTDLTDFVNQIQAKEQLVTSKGGLQVFKGHAGGFVKNTDLPLFDKTKFDNGDVVFLYTPIVQVSDCENSILKQNSLLVTDLSVVEDPARTYNIVNGTGNPQGAWTFSHVIEAAARPAQNNITMKEFLKQWLRTFISIQSVANGTTVARRDDAMLHMIAPWIHKVWDKMGNSTSQLPPISAPNNAKQPYMNQWLDDPTLPLTTQGNPAGDGDIANWEEYWDMIDEDKILQYAPFKLTAIVNRFDLRGNFSYSQNSKIFGETRFVFTLLDPFTGIPPVHDNIIFLNQGGVNDWVGMNIILEFANPCNNLCDLKNFVHQWYDLSSQPLGTVGNPNLVYNQMLEDITEQVLNPVNITYVGENGSLLRQLRTNEKIFDRLDGFASGASFWAPPDWEMRQYEFTCNDDFLHLVPVTNTPVSDVSSGGASEVNWIYGPTGTSPNKARVAAGNYDLPQSLLRGSAILEQEMTSALVYDIVNLPSQIYNSNTYLPTVDNPQQQPKDIALQYSLNSCMGCHAGDTKTGFTMIAPRAYGQEAAYWGTTPTIETFVVQPAPRVGIDGLFNNSISTGLETYERSTNTLTPNHNLTNQTNDAYLQIVSPFLTGRKYWKDVSTNVISWQDDEVDDVGVEAAIGSSGTSAKLADNLLTGLYYSNDARNDGNSALQSGLNFGKGGIFPQVHFYRPGFNDLERRAAAMCSFLQSDCTGLIVVNPNTGVLWSTFAEMVAVPLPPKSH